MLAGVAAAVALATLVTFGSVLPKTFVNYDDNVYVTDNPHVRAGVGAAGVRWAFTTTTASNWHPVTWLSHMLDVQMFGLDAGKHHAVNLVLHAVNTALVFLLFATMTGAVWRSAFVAALFALHPLHVESFAWVAERKDVLSTMLWLATSLAWVRYVRNKTAWGYVLVAVLYALGLMCKPMLVTLPATLLLLDVWPLGRLSLAGGSAWRRVRPFIVEKAPLFAMAAVSCFVTSAAQHSGGALQTLTRFPFAGRLANALVTYVAYLGKTVWPSKLAVFYPYHEIALFSWTAVGAAATLAGVTALVVLVARRAPYVAFGWFWYLGTLVPVIGLVQVGAQSMADRYTYVPLIGLFVGIVWGFQELFGRPGAVAACAWLVALGLVSRGQLGVWADRRSLFEHAIAVTADNWVAHGNLGNTLLNEGDMSAAIAHFNEAIRIDPSFSDAYYNRGLAMARLGRHDEAVADFERAIQLNPGFANAHVNLGGALLVLGKTDAALEELRTAVRLDPTNRTASSNLANLYVQAGRDAEAVETFSQVLRIAPGDAETIDRLGLALTRLERWPEAIERFQQELVLRPGAAEVHNSLGYSLARAGRMSEALQQFQEAIKIEPGNEEAIHNARMAQAALGSRPVP
jgi:Flp pilus assembly protein TadD